MSAANKRADVEQTDAMLRRRAEIQASGKPPAPLNAEWQRELRALVQSFATKTNWPPDQICLLVMAELLRWMRDELGYDADYAAELAAGFAEVFPKYGGEQDAAAGAGGVQ